MGWTLTGCRFRYNRRATNAVADGNNVAWCCPACSAEPILFVYRRGRRGSARETPSQCPCCQSRFFLHPEVGPGPQPAGTIRPAETMRIVRLP